MAKPVKKTRINYRLYNEELRVVKLAAEFMNVSPTQFAKGAALELATATLKMLRDVAKKKQEEEANANKTNTEDGQGVGTNNSDGNSVDGRSEQSDLPIGDSLDQAEQAAQAVTHEDMAAYIANAGDVNG